MVGDDDQSIYGFRSEVQHILNFPKDWRGATEIRLEANYRSVASILELANTLIAYNAAMTKCYGQQGQAGNALG